MDADRPDGRARTGKELDLEALSRAAREAEGREAYLEISRTEAHRMGVVASVFPSDCVYFTLECTFRLFREDGGVEPVRLERASGLVRALDARGYELTHLDDGWISCEKMLPPEEVAPEVRDLLDCLARGPMKAATGVSEGRSRSPAPS